MGIAEAWVQSAPTLRGIYLYTPFHAGFVAELKALVPDNLRIYEGNDKRWYVFESYAEQAVRLAQKYWRDIDLSLYQGAEKESQANRQSFRERMRESARANGYGRGQRPEWGQHRASAVASTQSDCATLYVTEDAPFEVINAAYRALAKMVHPDTGKTPDALLMVKYNQAHERLQKAGRA